MTKKITIEEKTCKACGHSWLPRTAAEPRVCPHCKSRFWKEGRKRAVRGTGKKAQGKREGAD